MFDLSRELVDEIIFAMENQDEVFVVDTTAGAIVPVTAVVEPIDESRYLPIPDWNSAHGYTLMERFVGSLKNPLFREALREALAAGKGVFRGFKNALKQSRELERLWHHFKERQMRREVLTWYNSLRESWGLSEVEIDFGPDEDLVLSDFAVVEGRRGTIDDLLRMDRNGFRESHGEDSSDPEAEYERSRMGRRPEGPEELVYTAVSPSQEVAGFVWASPDGGAAWTVMQVYVAPEYRGIGLAGVLLSRLREEALRRGAKTLTVDIAGSGLVLDAALRRAGFATVAEVLRLDLER